MPARTADGCRVHHKRTKKHDALDDKGKDVRLLGGQQLPVAHIIPLLLGVHSSTKASCCPASSARKANAKAGDLHSNPSWHVKV